MLPSGIASKLKSLEGESLKIGLRAKIDSAT